ncbi:MAG: L-seryl-tRNA(Sec) selenium transferase, partial [Planctomycetales bacterium]|nr:L-seryl-tRNA(Sec) selenium transferase [Planctomycetales bacterium]
MSANLRCLPAVDHVLRQPELAALHACHAHAQLVTWTRQALERARAKLLDEAARDAAHAATAEAANSEAANSEAACWLRQIVDEVVLAATMDRASKLRTTINATGVLLHTNLGRSPLAVAARERMAQVAGYANVELDLAEGRRSQRGARVCRLFAELSGAEAALVVNNCAAATWLALAVLGRATFAESGEPRGGEVIISRGQLVEIGGGFRLPEVFESAQVALREVGTTNRTYLRDYQSAFGERTGAVLRVHRSNFRLEGFVTEPSCAELAAWTRSVGVPLIDDIGSGCAVDLSGLGLDEPTIQQSVLSGADLTLFSGDKLLGGPQCGIVVGRRELVERLGRHPIMRAVRVDKVTLGALEATAEIYLAGRAWDEIPVLKMLAKPPEQVREDCRRLLAMLSESGGRAGAVWATSVAACESPVGGGSAPGHSLPSFGIRIAGERIDELAGALRIGQP